MQGQTVKIRSTEGREFDCYLAQPDAGGDKVPAVVLACAVHGVDAGGADDIVEHPALLLEPPHMRFAALVHDRLRDALHRFLP